MTNAEKTLPNIPAADAARLAKLARYAAERAAEFRGERVSGYPIRSFAAIAAEIKEER